MALTQTIMQIMQDAELLAKSRSDHESQRLSPYDRPARIEQVKAILRPQT